MSGFLNALKRLNWLAIITLWVFAIALYFSVALPTWQAARSFGSPMLISGYSLFACIVFLGLFKVRKHLSMIPLLPARFWFSMHSMMGVLALMLYGLHVDKLWPESGYVQLLAGLMIAVSITGLIGYLIEKIFPSRLTQNGEAIIFEKIPDACYQTRQQAEHVLFEQIQETASETLSHHYMKSLDWYFRKPRFLFNHISGGRKAEQWIKQHFDIVNRYLNENERNYSKKLEALANKKHNLDYQYAIQGLLKVWLLVHVPLSTMLIVMSVWHLLLVNIYSV